VKRHSSIYAVSEGNLSLVSPPEFTAATAAANRSRSSAEQLQQNVVATDYNFLTTASAKVPFLRMPFGFTEEVRWNLVRDSFL
jgi:hypothetical protein